MRVLVTGAAGFIGHWVCRQALVRGLHVTALVHRSTERLEGLRCHPDFVEYRGDLCDTKRVEQLIGERAIEAVCHLAVVPPGAAAQRAHAVNVEATRSLVKVAKEMGIKRMVYTSSMSVYDFVNPHYTPVDERHPTQPLQEYGREKRAGEECVLTLGVNAVVLRLCGIYGPDRRTGAVYNFIRALSEKKRIEIAEDRAVDVLSVQDVADAILDALQNQSVHGVFNVGAGQPLRLSALAGELGEIMGAEVDLSIAAEGREFYMDISRARAAWSYAPQSREQALRSYVEWILDKGVGHGV